MNFSRLIFKMVLHPSRFLCRCGFIYKALLHGTSKCMSLICLGRCFYRGVTCCCSCGIQAFAHCNRSVVFIVLREIVSSSHLSEQARVLLINIVCWLSSCATATCSSLCWCFRATITWRAIISSISTLVVGFLIGTFEERWIGRGHLQRDELGENRELALVLSHLLRGLRTLRLLRQIDIRSEEELNVLIVWYGIH